MNGLNDRKRDRGYDGMYDPLIDKWIVYGCSHVLVALVSVLVYIRYFGGC